MLLWQKFFLSIRTYTGASAAHAVPCEIFIEMEIVVAVHFQRLCNDRPDDIIGTIAAASQGERGLRRVDSSDEGGVAAANYVRNARQSKVVNAHGVAVLVHDAVASD